MKLQVAFDDISLNGIDSILEKSISNIDIVEFGTLSVIRYGLSYLNTIKEKYPNCVLLVDPKIMDAPKKIAEDCFKNKADIVTVMSVAGIETVKKVIEVANKYNKEVMVDLLGEKDIENTISSLNDLDIDYICVHSSKNENVPPLQNFIKAKSLIKNAKIALAGGINLDNLPSIVKENPDVVIIGSMIYESEDPKTTIERIKEQIQ